MALGDQRLGKIVGPACFRTLDLDQGSADGFIGSVRFAALDLVDDVGQTLVHSVFIAGIAAEEEVIHVEAIQHDLIAHGFDGTNALESHAGVGARRSFLESSDDIHYEQHRKNGQDQAETGVKFFSDGHCKMPPLNSAGRHEDSRFRRYNPSSTVFLSWHETHTRQPAWSLPAPPQISIPSRRPGMLEQARGVPRLRACFS